MNIYHIKYALEIAKEGSVGRAAERLHVAQPNLSRALKELETNLGIRIFDRTPKGMRLTPEGSEFIGYARKIMEQINTLEGIYRNKTPEARRFSLTVPCAAYIADAFARFLGKIDITAAEITYQEVSSLNGLRSLINGENQLGILRYPTEHEPFFLEMMRKNGFTHQTVSEFNYAPVFRKDNLLAETEAVLHEDLEALLEITPGNPALTVDSIEDLKTFMSTGYSPRRIFVEDRGSMLEFLASNPKTYLFAAPFPTPLLERYGLVQRPLKNPKRTYRDVLIYRKHRPLTDLELEFIRELDKTVKKYFKD